MNVPTSSPVAVIITCFNLGRTLDESVASVLGQTLSPAHLTIVDDGSTDVYTIQVLSRLEREGHHLVRTSNHGVSAARNIGVRLTSSRYIVLLDADDMLLPSYLEKASAYLDRHLETAFVSCGMECFGAVHQLWTPPAPTLISALSGSPVHISSMFRRELWDAVGGFDESLFGHEEVDFWTTALERGFAGHVLEEPLLRYRVRRGSMYHRSIQREAHAHLMDVIYRKHQPTVERHAEALLMAKERFIVEQQSHQLHLHSLRQKLEEELREVDDDISEATAALSSLGHARVEFGDLRRTAPISPVWGQDRGAPLDRHYIEAFLEQHREAIRGRVLEIKDPVYTLKFGGDRVVASDVLDIDPLNQHATIVADLTAAHGLPSDSYDCFILTQTLGLVYDVRSAVAEAFRLLKPGGVLLCTVPASGRIGYEEGQGLDGDFWRFTEASVRRLFAEVFPAEAFTVTGYGNVLSAAAFLFGLSSHELTVAELSQTDPFFPVLYGIRAVKPQTLADGNHTSPFAPGGTPKAVVGLILMYHRVSNHETVAGLSVTPETFRAHMTHLVREGYTVVPLRELRSVLLDGETGAPRIAITFDDGYAETARWCVPILEELSFPATFFIVGAGLDGPIEFWWDTLHRVFLSSRSLPERLALEVGGCWIDLPTLSDPERRAAYVRLTEAFYFLSRASRDETLRQILAWSAADPSGPEETRPMEAAELLSLSRVGGISIGAHTENHLWLPTLASDDRYREIAGTKLRLEALLGQPVTSFAYPYGAVDAETAEQVKTAGFDEAVSATGGLVLSGDDSLGLPRLDVGGCSAAAFRELLRRAWGSTPDSFHKPHQTRTLIAGWFSFEQGHATAGDFVALDLTRAWLAEAGETYDVALTSAFPGGLDWRRVDPSDYSQVVFVCGPFGKGAALELPFLERFAGNRMIGLNLSMMEPVEEWNPFSVLLERDSSATSRPDIVFLAPPASLPVVGVCRVEPFEGGQTELADKAIDQLVAEGRVAAVHIDTRLDVNAGGLRTPGEIESVISRMDAVITTRLHGLVFALKNGVPAVAIDPEPGPAKIMRQARAIGWPLVFPADGVSAADLRSATEYCLSKAGRAAAQECAARARQEAEKIHRAFVLAVSRGTPHLS